MMHIVRAVIFTVQQIQYTCSNPRTIQSSNRLIKHLLRVPDLPELACRLEMEKKLDRVRVDLQPHEFQHPLIVAAEVEDALQ